MDTTRLDELRRRVQGDPASIAFAQLAEECRRAGLLQEAVEVSRAGLSLHSDYLLARLTLGRALLQLGQIDVAQRELDLVRGASPRNLACLRALAELHRQRGDMPEALALYRAALAVAPNDPELDQTVGALCQEVVERAEAARELRSTRLLTFLEQWLSAIHVTRAQRSS